MLFLETNANSIIWAHIFAGVQKAPALFAT